MVPSNEVNLHFTGDIHAITSANNLLAAILDNELHFHGKGEGTGLDPRRVTWRRGMDMNDRSLRNVMVGLGGRAGGVPRESGFDITAASEVMAVLCLACSREDLTARLLKPEQIGRFGAMGAPPKVDAISLTSRASGDLDLHRRERSSAAHWSASMVRPVLASSRP
jgi:hypothetical protein